MANERAQAVIAVAVVVGLLSPVDGEAKGDQERRVVRERYLIHEGCQRFERALQNNSNTTVSSLIDDYRGCCEAISLTERERLDAGWKYRGLAFQKGVQAYGRALSSGQDIKNTVDEALRPACGRMLRGVAHRR
jgi:hypothetical protein